MALKINISAGHNPDGSVACGAIGLIKESTEARKVVREMIVLLKQEGHIVYDCTVNDGTSSGDVLRKIIAKCNANTVDLDISVHFNAGVNDRNGNGRTTGCECLLYSSSSKAASYGTRMNTSVAKLGYTNRGLKYRTDLYYLKNTKAPALLFECCFVDDKDDVNIYDFKTMAKAMVEGILNKSINTTTSSSTTAPSITPNVKYGVNVHSFSTREQAIAFQTMLKNEKHCYSEVYEIK